MRLLSIDPGYDKTGFAVFTKAGKHIPEYVHSGLIKTNPADPIDIRIRHILTSLTEIIDEYVIDTMVMEQLFFFKNAKTVIGVAQAQGAIIGLASQRALSFSFLTPLQIKQMITGNGRAEKRAVWKMLQMELGDSIHACEDDESDAIACGYAYCMVVQSPLRTTERWM